MLRSVVCCWGCFLFCSRVVLESGFLHSVFTVDLPELQSIQMGCHAFQFSGADSNELILRSIGSVCELIN